MNKETIKEKLSSYEALRISDERFDPAAVLMPLFKKDDSWHVLLTLRSSDVATHQNQISFPGGRLDEGESALDAALRETYEEVGIKPKDVELLGALDDIITITKYRITPFVGVIPYPFTLCVSEKEIAEIIEIPLDAFLIPEIFRRETSWCFEGNSYPVYYFTFGRHVVWGATAKIIKQFLEVVMNWREPLNK